MKLKINTIQIHGPLQLKTHVLINIFIILEHELMVFLILLQIQSLQVSQELQSLA